MIRLLGEIIKRRRLQNVGVIQERIERNLGFSQGDGERARELLDPFRGAVPTLLAMDYTDQ